MLLQGEVSKTVLLFSVRSRRALQKVCSDFAKQSGAASRKYMTRKWVSGRFQLLRSSFIFVGDDDVLGVDRVLDPSGTETW